MELSSSSRAASCKLFMRHAGWMFVLQNTWQQTRLSPAGLSPWRPAQPSQPACRHQHWRSALQDPSLGDALLAYLLSSVSWSPAPQLGVLLVGVCQTTVEAATLGVCHEWWHQHQVVCLGPDLDHQSRARLAATVLSLAVPQSSAAAVLSLKLS